jgi:hypothetical protein
MASSSPRPSRGSRSTGLRAEAFLILPHEKVRTYYQRKGQDIDRWIAGMRRLAAEFDGQVG